MSTPTPTKGFHRRAAPRVVLWGILLLVLYVSLEGASWLALVLLKELKHIEFYPLSTTSLGTKHRSILKTLLEGKTNYVAFSSTLGWTIKPNGFLEEAPFYRANAGGLRSDREYDVMPSPGIIRISTFGDSFTHGDGVANEETWQEYMRKGGDTLEVLNFGVSGYGLDQAFLRYQEQGVHYYSHIVLIGFMSENIYRTVSVFRPFYYPATGLPLAKPRFALASGGLILYENPMQALPQYEDLLHSPQSMLPTLGKHDYYCQRRYTEGNFDYSPLVRAYKVLRYEFVESRQDPIVTRGHYNEDSEAFKVTVDIFDRFVRSVLKSDALPIIIVFPHEGDVRQFRQAGLKGYAPLLQYFHEQGYLYLDILDAFETSGRTLRMGELFQSHYSSRANRVVAEYLLQYLDAHHFLNVNAVRREIAALRAQLPEM